VGVRLAETAKQRERVAVNMNELEMIGLSAIRLSKMAGHTPGLLAGTLRASLLAVTATTKCLL